MSVIFQKGKGSQQVFKISLAHARKSQIPCDPFETWILRNLFEMAFRFL